MTDGKNIVLIEDEEVILELLRAKFENAGLRVQTARDGISGFELVKETKPDLVLLDMLLPGRNGLRVLEKMKEEGLLPSIPVLVISNSGQPVELERALDLGARDYLIKVNFDPQEILMRVQAILSNDTNRDLSTAPAGTAGNAKKVLIVEDDTLLVTLLERKFVSSGYQIERAFDVEQARRLLEKMPIDVILLDVVLPGVDGFSFLAELKKNERSRNIPVVVISNLGQREEVEKGFRLGAADYIVKANISPAEIVEKVGALIKK